MMHIEIVDTNTITLDSGHQRVKGEKNKTNKQTNKQTIAGNDFGKIT